VRVHAISASSVKRLLPTLGYSRQANRKADEGSKHPDRNAQFEHINAKVVAAQATGQPVISVDTKKKELVGNYKVVAKHASGMTAPTTVRKGDPRRVKVHDFEDKELGKVVPYGVYDVGAKAGWVSVGITSDMAQFAVASIRRWLDVMVRERYPDARELTITADAVAARMERVSGCGRSSCKSSPMPWAWCFTSITIRRARRSGTRSSTACSATSHRRGAAGR
jgi:hypothetical protein